MPAAIPNLEAGSIASYRATSAISVNRLVKYDTSNENQIVACSAITDVAIGVALNECAAGDMCDVQVAGVARIRAGGAITIGAPVACQGSAGGSAVVAAGLGGTALPFGIAESAAASGETFRARLKCPNLAGPVNV